MPQMRHWVLFAASVARAAAAAAAAAAQEVPGRHYFAPWPMRGGDAANTGQGYVPTANNSVEVLKLNFTNSGSETAVLSSPAIGADGTVYVRSLDRGNLYAINPDGSQKWKFAIEDVLSYFSSPAVGADGTVYIGAYDCKLYAINSDGTQKWKFVHLGPINSSPAIGADGTVYVGSQDKYLYAISSDGTQKWKFATGLGIFVSSPAIGADGTVYVGSEDKYLYAISSDGTQKWKFATEAGVASSPAIGADGTVYVGSGDGNLYAISSDGTQKWKFATGRRIYGSSPAIGADGTVYVGSLDSNLYAISSDGSQKWKFATEDTGRGAGTLESSPAIGADGTVYVGSSDNNLYAINSDGTQRWKLTTEYQYYYVSSPAIGADGTVYFASGDTLVRLGLSEGYVTSQLHTAQIRELRNASGAQVLEHLCNFSQSIHFVPRCKPKQGCNVCSDCCKDYIPAAECNACFTETCPKRNDSFTEETDALVNASCRMLESTKNAAAYGRSWGQWIDSSLSFEYFENLIGPSGAMMTLLVKYENKLQQFIDRETALDDQLALAQDAVKGYETDEESWHARIAKDTAAFRAYGKEVVSLGQQMDTKYRAVHEEVHSLIANVQGQLVDLNSQLREAKREDEARRAFSFFGALFNVVKAFVAVGTCFSESVETAGAALLACGKSSSDDIQGAISSVKGCVQTFRSSCEPCKKIKDEMAAVTQAESDIQALAEAAKAARALNDQLDKGAPLPAELPQLISDEIAMGSVQTSVHVFQQEISKAVGHASEQFLADITDCTNMGVTRMQMFLSYYNVASRVQNDQSSLKALKARSAIVASRGQSYQEQMRTVTTGALLMKEKQQKQAGLVLKYLYEAAKQFHFLSLRPMPRAALAALPDDPQSTDILVVENALLADYQAEVEKQKSRALRPVYIEIPEKSEPRTVAELRVNGSTTVILPIPLRNVTDPATNATKLESDTSYYQMRLHDVSVYLLDANGTVIGAHDAAQVALSKSGLSYFFGEDMELHVFSHAEVTYGSGSFVYDPKTACPIGGNYCGDLCPDYIRYSPFGIWKVAVYSPEEQGIDMSRLAALRFEFAVEYKQKPGFSPNIFGKPPNKYPQDFGSLCNKHSEEVADSKNSANPSVSPAFFL